MNTVFSHIVQTHLSHQNEDIATEELAFCARAAETRRSHIRFPDPSSPPCLCGEGKEVASKASGPRNARKEAKVAKGHSSLARG